MEKAIRKDDGESPEAEIASLISEIAERKARPQASYASRLKGGDARAQAVHPSEGVLQLLDRREAHREIAGIADEIRERAAERISAEVIPLRPSDWSWISDAATAREARDRAEERRGMRAPLPTSFLSRRDPVEDAPAARAEPDDPALAELEETAPRFDHSPEPEPEKEPEPEAILDTAPEDVLPEEPEPVLTEAREDEAYEDVVREEEAHEEDIAVAAIPAPIIAPTEAPVRTRAKAKTRAARHAAKRARPEPRPRPQMERKELPLWYTLGLPLAAVSAAALTVGIGLMNPPEPGRFLTVDAGAGDDTGTALTELALAGTGAASVTERAPAAATPEPAPAEPVSVEPAPTERASTAPAPDPVPATVAEAPVEIAPVPETRPVVTTRIASIPGAKPARSGAATTTTETPDPATETAVVADPVSPVPERVFVGTIADGSAGDRLIAHANADAAIPLTRTEERWLARDVDAVLDREPDGRLATVSSSRSDIFAVSLDSTSQSLRRLPVTRAADVAPLPDNMVLEGGWHAALRDTPMRPLPSSGSVFENRVLRTGDQVQLMATVTDRNGVRWSLMGQRGVAIGYVSPADIMPSETFAGDLGPVFASGHGRAVTEDVTVFTRCRSVTIGPFGETGEPAQLCRNSLGHWIPATTGTIDADYASLEPIVFAALPQTDALPEGLDQSEVRASVERSLRYALDGRSVTHRTPDGERLDVTFDTTFTETLSLPVARSEDIGRLSEGLTVDAGWREVAGETRLRPLPDASAYLTGATLRAGHAIETLATYEAADETVWTLVGQSGVGVGFVRADELKPLSAANLPVADMLDVPELVDVVQAERTCRGLELAGSGETTALKACQGPGGQWVIEGKAEVRRLARNGQQGQIAP